MKNTERIIPTVWISERAGFDNLIEAFINKGIKEIRINCTRHSINEYKKEIYKFQEKNGANLDLLIDVPIPKKKVRIFYDWNGNEKKLLNNKVYRILRKEDPNKQAQDIFVDDDDYYALQKIPSKSELTIGENCAKVKIESTSVDEIYVRCVTGGTVAYGKYITSPEMRFANCSENIVKSYIDLANSTSCKSVALSFVENAEEINWIRNMLKGNTKIISKIETIEGVKNINEIINASDGIMIARGDLLINVGYELFAKSCNDIVMACEKCKKKYYFATGIFESYSIDRKIPSRSELCELFNIFKYTSASVILEYNKCKTSSQAIDVLDIIEGVIV